MINVTPLAIPDVIVIEPKVFEDPRGFFFESFNLKDFTEVVGTHIQFVQDNHSKSSKDVLRGLHFQNKPAEQGKLVRVTRGEVFDVAVDIRPESSTFGKWVSCNLSATNKKQLWIPAGFAHGFLTLSDDAEVLYKATHHYSPEHDCSIVWNDPEIAIKWPVETPIISDKDKKGKFFKDLFFDKG